MKFQETFDFDHDVDTIARMFGDRDYYLDKYARLGGRQPELVDCNKEGDDFSITVRHALDATQLSFPDFVKKRIGDHVILNQTDAWQLDKRDGRIDIDIEKTPVTIGIAMKLVDNQGSARLELAFDISADVPLLGGQVEKAIAKPITRRMQDDLELSRKMAEDYTQPTA